MFISCTIFEIDRFLKDNYILLQHYNCYDWY